MDDLALECRDCTSPFTFTAGEQEFFASKGYNNPTRCPSCRQARKGAGNGSSSRPPRQMYDAFCPEGQHVVQVPFQVDTSRPFYCRDCKEERDRRLNTYSCEDCGRSFRTEKVLDGSRGIRCRDCYVRNKQEYEASLNAYVCDFCSTAFKTPRDLDPSRGIRCRDCNDSWKRGDLGNSGYCCECGSFVVLPFIPDADKWIRCQDCRADWESRRNAERFGFDSPGSSRKYGSGPMIGQDKPTSINVGPGMSVPIPRSTNAGGFRINRGGGRRDRSW